LVPSGSTLKYYALAISLPSQGIYFLIGPLGALNLHVFSIGMTDRSELLIFDRMSKKTQVLTPQTVTWVLWKKHWLSDSLTIALPDQSRQGFMLTHRSASLPTQTQQLEAISSALAEFPQKQTRVIDALSWLKVFALSFLLSCISIIPLVVSRLVSQSYPLFILVMIISALGVVWFANMKFKYPSKMTSALAGASYGIFFGIFAAFSSKTVSSTITILLAMSIVGLLFGFVFGFMYGVFTKQDQYQDFSS